jgi:hypothetical protein
MTQLQNHSLPAPGDAIYATVGVGDPTAPRLEVFRFNRPEQETSLSGFADFKALLTSIDPFTIATILMALLMERRVIFISRKLSILSSCVQACVALLYPFTWQHVFIPVLPLGMIQFVCAPVPFVVGLLASHLGDLQAQAELMDEVLLIDVESSSPVPPTTDFKMVPEKYFLPLVATIAKARKVVLEEKKKAKSEKSVGDKLKNFFNNPGDRQSMAPGSRTTVALAELYKEQSPQDNVAKIMENAFISFFAETMGHYTQFLTANSFDKKAFLEFDPQLTPFLTGVGGSQLFEQFIAQRQNSSRIKGKTSLGSLPSPRGLSSTKADLTTDAKLADVVVREGYLSKWGKGMKGTAWARLKEGKDHRGTIHEGSMGTFQLRYWKLSYFALTYHKSEDSKPSGTIPLSDIESVNLVEWRGAKDCLEIVTADRCYQLHTENNADVNWWLEILQWKIALVKEYTGLKLGHGASSVSGKASTSSSSSSTSKSTTSGGVSASTSPTSYSPSSLGGLGDNSSGSAPGSFSSATYPLGSSIEQPPASVPLRHNSAHSSNGASSDIPQTRTTNRPPSKTLVSSYMKERVNAWGQAPKAPAAPPSSVVRMGTKPTSNSLSSSSKEASASPDTSTHAQHHPTPPPLTIPPPAYVKADGGRSRSSALHGGPMSEQKGAHPPLPAPPQLPTGLHASTPPNRYGSNPLTHSSHSSSGQSPSHQANAASHAGTSHDGAPKVPRPLMRSHDGFASSAPSTPTSAPSSFGAAVPTVKSTSATPSPVAHGKSFRRLPTPPSAPTTDYASQVNTSTAPSLGGYRSTEGTAGGYAATPSGDSSNHDVTPLSPGKSTASSTTSHSNDGSTTVVHGSDLSSSTGANSFRRVTPLPVPPTLHHTVSAPLQYSSNGASARSATLPKSFGSAANQPPAAATSRPLPRPPQ